ncbi:MAG: iron-sulfur cluster assembly accessory protein [Pseudomonadota bacterium]
MKPVESKRPAILTITAAAAEQIKLLLAKRTKPAAGVRISLKVKGCAGMAYKLEYTDAPQEGDEIVQQHGVKIFIDPKAVMFLLGTEMDYREEALQSGFTFLNPNEKGRCGCGESFHV